MVLIFFFKFDSTILYQTIRHPVLKHNILFTKVPTRTGYCTPLINRWIFFRLQTSTAGHRPSQTSPQRPVLCYLHPADSSESQSCQSTLSPLIPDLMLSENSEHHHRHCYLGDIELSDNAHSKRLRHNAICHHRQHTPVNDFRLETMCDIYDVAIFLRQAIEFSKLYYSLVWIFFF